jgi:hypothetical protein
MVKKSAFEMATIERKLSNWSMIAVAGWQFIENTEKAKENWKKSSKEGNFALTVG